MLPAVLREHGVAPIFAHFRVDEILIDAGELFAQHFVKTFMISMLPFMINSLTSFLRVVNFTSVSIRPLDRLVKCEKVF